MRFIRNTVFAIFSLETLLRNSFIIPLKKDFFIKSFSLVSVYLQKNNNEFLAWDCLAVFGLEKLFRATIPA